MKPYQRLFEDQASNKNQVFAKQFLANLTPIDGEKDGSLLFETYIYSSDPKEITSFLDSIGYGKHQNGFIAFKKLKHNLTDMDYSIEGNKAKIVGRFG